MVYPPSRVCIYCVGGLPLSFVCLFISGRSGQVVFQEGVAILTSHRVIWYHSQASKAVHGHLQDIVNARISRNFFKSST